MGGKEMEVYEFTYIRYEEGDMFQPYLGIVSLAPIVVFSLMFLLTFILRDLWAVFIGFGLVVEYLFGKLCKYMITMDRPLDSYLAGNGFPSHHTSSTVFFCTCMIYSLLYLPQLSQLAFTLRRGLRLSNAALSPTYRILVSLLLFVCGFILVPLSRYSLGVHSLFQVLAGVVSGSLLAWLWMSLLPIILSTPFLLHVLRLVSHPSFIFPFGMLNCFQALPTLPNA